MSIQHSVLNLPPDSFRDFFSGFITSGELRSTFLKRFDSTTPTSLSDFNPTATLEMMEIIRAVTENPQQYTRLLLQMTLHSKMIDLFTRSITHIQDQSEAKLSNIDRIKIRRIYNHLIENIDGQFTVDSLAEMIEMDRQNFKEHFKILYGKSISDFLRKERMKKAVSLLRDTTLPLSDIRLALGYKNVRLFSEVFSNYYGYSPSALRKRII